MLLPYEKILEKGWVPDFVLRAVIRWELKMLINKLGQAKPSFQCRQQAAELPPPEFFCQVLGRHMKYSCGNWAVQNADLDGAEEAMLRLIIQRAEILDGQDILEVSCGWGALSLEIARKFSRSKITALVNSNDQKTWIDQIAANEGLTNLCVVLGDIENFEPGLVFDRVVSVEALEYAKDFESFFHKISAWLRPNGKMFTHCYCHREYAHSLECGFAWRAYFFKGKIIPSENLFRSFDKDLSIVKKWKVPGLYYHRTYESWLKRMDSRKESILHVLAKTCGKDQALSLFQRWRIFFLIGSEMFRLNQGNEWLVSHTLFEKIS